jgi:hypothetical protein
LIEDNLVYGHDDPGSSGIYAFDATVTVLNNVVHTNYDGIYAPAGVRIDGNRIYNNWHAGVRTYTNSVIVNNLVYSNSVGIMGDYPFTGRISHNFIYANTNQAILIRAIGAFISNNTIYQIVGDGIRVQGGSRNVQVRNNILWVDSGYDIYVTLDSQAGFNSDYNLLHQGADPNAHVAFWGGTIRDSLASWQGVPGQDAHSFAADPLFVDLDGGDNTLGFTPENGGYDGGLDDNSYLRRNSPAIDRGANVPGDILDLEGYSPWDDPATANQGEAPYLDFGAFEFRHTSADALSPTIVSTDPLDINIGSPVPPTVAHIDLTFSEALNPISVRSRALYTLIDAGWDGTFGTVDDLAVLIASIDHTAGTTTARLTLNTALGEGRYRLTITSAPTNSIYDLAGNALDGDANGSQGGNFVLEFLVAGAAPTLTSITVNNGQVQRSRVSSLTLQFTEDVSGSLSPSDLGLFNFTTNSAIPASAMSIVFDTATNRATLTFPGLTNARLPDGNYRLTLPASSVTDRAGSPLTASVVFEFFVLTGDANADRVVNDLDLYLVWQNLLLPPSARNLNEDLTGDGQVTMADVNVVKSNYLATLPPYSPPSEASLEPSSLLVATQTAERPFLPSLVSLPSLPDHGSWASSDEDPNWFGPRKPKQRTSPRILSSGVRL